MAKLIIFSGTPNAREFELQPGANRIGRGDGNDFQITDPSVSTNHAQVIVEGAAVVIKDLNSTNGTFINHKQVGEGILQPGQPLRLGGLDIVFLADAPVAKPVPATAPNIAVAPATIVVPAPTRVAASAPSVVIAPAPVAAPPPKSVTAAPMPVPVIRIDISGSAAPPPPALKSASGGLKLSGAPAEAAAEELPADAPAAAPPGAMVYAEPPPGKTACKFHPKIGGHWLCRKCEELFCALCVTTKPSPAGTVHSCRKCGTVCVPVKPQVVVSKEKAVVVYSDKMLLVRSIGFGFGAALVGALIWIGLSYLFGFDIPFLFGPMVGALCGFAVKLGCQDTPSPVFSCIAVVNCIIGSVIGKLGMIAVTHLTYNSGTSLMTSGLGVCIAIYAAWKIGGDA